MKLVEFKDKCEKTIYTIIGLILISFSACKEIPEIKEQKIVKITEYKATILNIKRPKNFMVDIYISDLNWRRKGVGRSKHFKNWKNISVWDTILVDVYTMKGISTRTNRDTTWLELENNHSINQKLKEIYK